MKLFIFLLISLSFLFKADGAFANNAIRDEIADQLKYVDMEDTYYDPDQGVDIEEDSEEEADYQGENCEGTCLDMSELAETEQDNGDDSDEDEGLVEAEDLAEIQSAVYNAQKYMGSVIYIESQRRRGRWLSVKKYNGKLWAYFKSVHKDDVVKDLSVKWQVRESRNSKDKVVKSEVVLENMKYKRHFLDAHHSRWVKVIKSSWPQQVWFKWKIENVKNHEGTRFFFRSVRYKKERLDEYEGGSTYKYYGALAKGKGSYVQHRIYIPKLSDGYEKLREYDNTEHGTEAHYTYQKTVGFSESNTRTSEITDTLGVELGVEVEKAFATFTGGLSYSKQWTETTSSTYTKYHETTDTISIKVPPRKKVILKQLVGHYGTGPHRIDVHSTVFKLVTVNRWGRVLKTKRIRGDGVVIQEYPPPGPGELTYADEAEYFD